MILKFSNELDCEENNLCKKNLDLDRCCKCLKMRRNMMNLLLRNELQSEEEFFNRANSQKKVDITKKSKKNKNGNKNEEISKNQHDIKYINLNSNEEKNKINEDYLKEKNEIGKINENNNNIEISTNTKEEIKIEEFNENINIEEQKSDNKLQKEDEINLKKKNSIDLNIDNIKNEIKLNDSDNNVKSISNNAIANFLGIGNNMNISPLNQLETFSINSYNESAKNLKNKKTSFHSSSLLGKNFILKTDIYKKRKQNENKEKNNNYSDNPIMNYYSGKHFSNFTNFYMADIKSPEDIDENHYINFFPNKESINENNADNKEENYGSYSSIENKRKGIIKENNNIIEEDNIDDKIKIEKLNLDFINNNSSLLDDNSNSNINNQVDLKNNNINIKEKDFNDFQIQNENYNNINNNNNDFKFPLSKNQNINNKNFINYYNNNNNNTFNTMNNINDINIINNPNLFNFENNNNDFFDVNEIKNLKELKLDKNIFTQMQNLDLNKMNLNYQQLDNYQHPNNYYIPISNEYENPNLKYNYITYNNNVLNQSGLPSGKSFYEYTEDDLIKYAIPLIKDQSGCRFLQEKIKSNENFMENKLFPSIKNDIFELGCDAFGNYFLQALLDIFSYENLNLFLDLIKNKFKDMCTNQHGTRVIQKIIDKVYSDKNLSTKLGNILNTKDLGIIMKSSYGNHIIQKFITSIHFKELTKFVYDYVIQNFMEIAETKHGVCVIQKCVSEGDIDQRGKLYDLILQNFYDLIKDEFGNYLIQYILINLKSKEKFYEVLPIIQKIEDNLISICKYKFSANIIEKCLENGENFVKEYLLNCLLNRYHENIIELLLDQYGIYIIQKAIKYNSFYRNRFYEIIKEKGELLKNIDLNDFKYRGAQKVLNSFKDLDLFSQNQNTINRDSNNNNSGNHNNNFHNYNNNDYRNNYNNKRKNKRGRKNYRGK